MTQPIRTLIAAAALSALSLSAHAADAYGQLSGDPSGSYAVDSDHSYVTYTIGHVGVGISPGALTKVSGHYQFDPAKPEHCQADITVAANSIDTFMPLRNEHIQSPAWLNAQAYPTIHFVSSRYTPTDATHGVLDGQLTLHGVTRPVQFKVTEVGAGDVGYLPKPWGGHLTGFVATTSIDRLDYGISAFAGAVGHQVDITVAIEGVKQ